MLAIDESASSFCAREMRGTLSIASTVTCLAASSCSSCGFCAGQMKLTRTWPARIDLTSSALGARTLKTMSAPDQTDGASGTTFAPAAAYASSEMLAAAPAPDWTITLKPSFCSFAITSGTVATRFSPGKTSFGTPITWAMCFFFLAFVWGCCGFVPAPILLRVFFPRSHNKPQEERLHMNRVMAALVAAVAAFGLATAGAQDNKTRISIGTGGTGGVYYPLGGGLAAILSKYVPGVDATAEV